jgi:hypothetical protein
VDRQSLHNTRQQCKKNCYGHPRESTLKAIYVNKHCCGQTRDYKLQGKNVKSKCCWQPRYYTLESKNVTTRCSGHNPCPQLQSNSVSANWCGQQRGHTLQRQQFEQKIIWTPQWLQNIRQKNDLTLQCIALSHIPQGKSVNSHCSGQTVNTHYKATERTHCSGTTWSHTTWRQCEHTLRWTDRQHTLQGKNVNTQCSDKPLITQYMATVRTHAEVDRPWTHTTTQQCEPKKHG